MNVDTAEKVTGLTVRACLFREDLSSFTEDDAKALGEFDLGEWIIANRICTERREQGYRGMVVETRGLAELYLRLTGAGHRTIKDVENLASAATDVFGETQNGYGVLIDDQRRATLIKLHRDGLSGSEVASAGSYERLHELVNDKAAAAA